MALLYAAMFGALPLLLRRVAGASDLDLPASGAGASKAVGADQDLDS